MGRHVAKAEKERGRCEGTLARWQAEAAAKRAELADLESRLGDDVLADEASAVRLTRQVADLRAAVDTADRTAASAAQRLADACVDVDLARADYDRLIRPHRDGLIWPHVRRAGVVVTV